MQNNATAKFDEDKFDKDKSLSEYSTTTVKTTTPNKIWEAPSVKIMLRKLDEILLKLGVKYELFINDRGFNIENAHQVVLMTTASRENINIKNIKAVLKDDRLVLFDGCTEKGCNARDDLLHLYPPQLHDVYYLIEHLEKHGYFTYVVCDYTIIKITIRSFIEFKDEQFKNGSSTLFIRIFNDGDGAPYLSHGQWLRTIPIPWMNNIW